MAKTTAGKNAKPVPDNRAGQPPTQSWRSSPGDQSKPLVRSRNGNEDVWRQPGSANTYNPDGITLAAIDMELVETFRSGDGDGSMPFTWLDNLELQVQDMKKAPALHRSGSVLFSMDFQKFESPDKLKVKFHEGAADRRAGVMDETTDFFQAQPTPDHLIQDSDGYLASLIKDHPLALLKCKPAQDGLARWTYAATWSHDPGTRKQARAYLKSIQCKKPGNPGKVTIDPAKLVRAYDDTRSYVKALYKCGKALHDVGQLLKYFPDAAELECVGVALNEITNPRMKGRAPSDVAADYAARFCGLSASHIINAVTAARGKADQRKP